MRAELYRLLTVACRKVGFQKASILCITYFYVQIFSNSFKIRKKFIKISNLKKNLVYLKISRDMAMMHHQEHLYGIPHSWWWDVPGSKNLPLGTWVISSNYPQWQISCPLLASGLWCPLNWRWVPGRARWLGISTRHPKFPAHEPAFLPTSVNVAFDIWIINLLLCNTGPTTEQIGWIYSFICSFPCLTNIHWVFAPLRSGHCSRQRGFSNESNQQESLRHVVLFLE